jgi:uncharacterized protein YozE (UPF0346 family)
MSQLQFYHYLMKQFGPTKQDETSTILEENRTQVSTKGIVMKYSWYP